MNKRIASQVAFACILFLALGLTTFDSAPVNLSVTLRITSTNPENVLSFDAAYLLGGKTGKPQFGKYHTPYEMSISVDDQYVAGLFSKTVGDGAIDVASVVQATTHSWRRPRKIPRPH